MRKLLFFLLVYGVSAVLPSGSSVAQQTQTVRGRIPTLVAISTRAQDSQTRFRVARFGGTAARDVIVLAADADAAVLTEAVEALLAVRRQAGDLATADGTFRTSTPQRVRVLPWAARVLQDARAAPPREIPAVGRMAAVQIWLPAQQPAERRFRAGH